MLTENQLIETIEDFEEILRNKMSCSFWLHNLILILNLVGRYVFNIKISQACLYPTDEGETFKCIGDFETQSLYYIRYIASR